MWLKIVLSGAAACSVLYAASLLNTEMATTETNTVTLTELSVPLEEMAIEREYMMYQNMKVLEIRHPQEDTLEYQCFREAATITGISPRQLHQLILTGCTLENSCFILEPNLTK